jgi:hypothetical protein
MTTLYTCPKCGAAMERPSVAPLPTRDELLAELVATRTERDSLADALWAAEDQWGDDYLWDKWDLSKPLTAHRKRALSDAADASKVNP